MSVINSSFGRAYCVPENVPPCFSEDDWRAWYCFAITATGGDRGKISICDDCTCEYRLSMGARCRASIWRRHHIHYGGEGYEATELGKEE